jgi:hypothetical protein
VSLCKGSQRGFGVNLAAHLLNEYENDHVEVFEVRGTAAQNLHGAFREYEAMAEGTRCREPFFHVSINPPEESRLSYEQFEQAVGKIEAKFGLQDQPRAVVFHEKEGRRHAHVVWSRIDGDKMRAVQLSHSKLKLRDVSRELYREFGLEMPRGYENRAERSRTAYGLNDWQRARRLGDDPEALKRTVQQAWNRADNRKAFAHALEQNGLYLARGDRRGFVVIDDRQQAHSLPRLLNVKSREVRQRLGDPKDLASVEQAQAMAKQRQSAAFDRRAAELKREHAAHKARMGHALDRQKTEHVRQRQTLKTFQRQRWRKEEFQRAENFRRGLMGLWDRFTGRYGQIADQNRQDAEAGRRRDRKEREQLIEQQRAERRTLCRSVKQERNRLAGELRALKIEHGIIQSKPRAHGYEEHTRPREPGQDRRQEKTFREEWTREAAPEQDRQQSEEPGRQQAEPERERPEETQPEDQKRQRQRGRDRSWSWDMD